MKKAERISGILVMVLFSAGLFFKYQLYPGSSIMLALSLLIFIFGYLIPHYAIQRRTAPDFSQQVYLVVKFVTYSLVMISAIMTIQHWPGGNALLAASKVLVACLVLFYLYLSLKGYKRLSTFFNDVVAAVLLLGIFIYFTNPRASKNVLEGNRLILDRVEQQNAGIASANQAIYESLDSIWKDEESSLKSGVERIRRQSQRLNRTFDSLTGAFISFCNASCTRGMQGSSTTLNPRVLHSGSYGEAFFIDAGNGRRIKSAIEEYTAEVGGIVREFNLPAGLTGIGLDVDDIRDEFGDPVPWETLMFMNQRVSSVMNNLLWIKQMILRTENTVLNGLISQADLSEEMKLLQRLAARESEKAMDLKENEIIRIRQQQRLQELQLEQSEAVLQQRNTTILIAFLGITFVLSLLVISTRAFYLKRKDNRRLAEHEREITAMNEALNQRNEEIMAQRDEIEAQRDTLYQQKDLIERSHSEISSSIDYACRLQTSILPGPGLLNTRIADHFVVFMPKQRVSGDFYWWTQVEDQVVITAADCTGHGVPGAFMSMLGVSMMREIVSKEYISHPGVILRRLRKEVMHALKQTGAIGEQKDGMDMALVSINVETLECQYAGANNPIYLVREGELTEYRADRMPIAIHQNMAKFTTHEIQLQKGDHLYLFTDGYVDQFGGPEGKKFKFTRFRQMLVDNAGLSMKKQKQLIESTFVEWKGEREQVDDVLVLGLEV
jgi:serine phosphatase RsbU (regulator of sigma subunit)